MMPDLKPCPFCGGEAYVREYNFGHSGGTGFYASHEIGCRGCNIAFTATSTFSLCCGELEYTKNGYERCLEKWNRRTYNAET